MRRRLLRWHMRFKHGFMRSFTETAGDEYLRDLHAACHRAGERHRVGVGERTGKRTR